MIDTSQPDFLARLMTHRWSLAVLSELRRTGGAKFVTLAHRLKVPRASLSSVLKHLVALDLVARNPGYGHPLRPEYLLTEKGARVADLAQRILRSVPDAETKEILLKKWSLPIVLAVGRDGKRFMELRESLAPITPRALTLGLKDMEGRRWVARTVVKTYPPSPIYTLQPPGLKTLPALEQINAVSNADLRLEQ